MSDKVIMTREGYDKLVKDLEHMKTTKRREIAEDIARARAFGDSLNSKGFSPVVK